MTALGSAWLALNVIIVVVSPLLHLLIERRTKAPVAGHRSRPVDDMPPVRAHHRDETVTTEGTPVTPPFATTDELVDYLATRGDFWDQERGDGPWDRKSAEEFVKAGWAPTLIVTGKRIITARRWRIVGPRPLSE